MHINLGLNEFFCGVICQFNWGTHLKSYHFCFFFLLLTCIYSFSQHNSSASKACFAAAILFTLERKELLTATGGSKDLRCFEGIWLWGLVRHGSVVYHRRLGRGTWGDLRYEY